MPLHKSARLILEDKPEKAVPVLRNLLKNYPDYAMVHFLLGLAYGKLDENVRAVAEEKKALVLNPKSEAARVSLGIALGNTGHFRQEIRSERQALALNPKDEMAWEAIGWAYASRRNWRLARASEEAAIKLRKSDPSAHMVLGVALAHLGFPEEGLSEEKTAALLDPEDRGVKRAIAWISTILHPVKEGSGGQGRFNPLLAPDNGPDIPGSPSTQAPANPNNNANGTLRAPVGH
ncbi:MAG: tetratricopeptide repeat protein [Nitrospirae bacterium]|nr:tetratricopeptide repeat protein [Nitrospirota bacterium]